VLKLAEVPGTVAECQCVEVPVLVELLELVAVAVPVTEVEVVPVLEELLEIEAVIDAVPSGRARGGPGARRAA